MKIGIERLRNCVIFFIHVDVGLSTLPCFTQAEWVPKCTKLCMNAMRKLQCVEVTVLQEFVQWTVDDVQVAGLLWAVQTRFDIRHHTPLASLGVFLPAILFPQEAGVT